MITFKVNTRYPGSYCVIHTGPGHYINARASLRKPGKSFIECASHGKARSYHVVNNFDAPEKIMEIVRGGWGRSMKPKESTHG